MLPSRKGAKVAKPPLAFRSTSVICGVRPPKSVNLANSALRSRIVIILSSPPDADGVSLLTAATGDAPREVVQVPPPPPFFSRLGKLFYENAERLYEIKAGQHAVLVSGPV